LAPETRHSWIEEVQRDGEYASRLIELCELYGPYIEGLCRARGLSPTDAEILTQQIQDGFSAKLRRYQRREGKPFHSWLSVVIRNAVDDWRQRNPIHFNQHSGREADLAAPEASRTSDEASRTPELTQELTARSLVFVGEVTEAIARVRERVAPRTWEAFVAYKLPKGPFKESSVAIAERLGFKTPDAVRVASARVLEMIKEEIANRPGLQEPSARAWRTIKRKLSSL
jgi:DNA-directed RNA polymerase specialized sigma24 family protein